MSFSSVIKWTGPFNSPFSHTAFSRPFFKFLHKHKLKGLDRTNHQLVHEVTEDNQMKPSHTNILFCFFTNNMHGSDLLASQADCAIFPV